MLDRSTRRQPLKQKRKHVRQETPAFFMPHPIADSLELLKASYRIGIAPKAWMQWVLKFANCNLGKLSTGGWMDLSYEVALFILVAPEAWRLGQYTVAPIQLGCIPSHSQLCVLPTTEEVEKFQAITNQHLEQLIESGSTNFPPFLAVMTVSLASQSDMGLLAISSETRLQAFL